MNRFSDLVSLARVARTQIEELNQIVKFNEYMQPLPHDLAGACGVASLHLLNLANKNGMNPAFVQGNFLGRGYPEGHCWVEYAGNIVDITATQFYQTTEKVFVRSLQKPPIYRANFQTKKLDEAEAQILAWTNYAPELRVLAG